MNPLYQELHRWAAIEHEWGYSDCMMVLSDWIMRVRGVDPFAEYRGTYGNPDVCPLGRKYRIEVEGMFRDALTEFDLVEDAQPGDIGLVQVPGDRLLCGAMKIKGRDWAMKTAGKGVVCTRAVRPVAIWGVKYEE